MSNDIFATLQASNDQNSFVPKIVDIYQSLNIQPDQLTAQSSISHVFRHVCENPQWKIPDPDDSAQSIKEQVVDRVEFRYSLLDTYAEDFFKNDKDYDHNALTMAIICDDLLDRPFKVSHASDQDNLFKAYQLWLDAADLEEYGLEDNDTPERSVWFLACVNAMEQLNNFKNNFNDFSLNELDEVKDSFFHIAGSLVDPDTSIGVEILKHLDDLDENIQRRHPAATVIRLDQRSPQLDL